MTNGESFPSKQAERQSRLKRARTLGIGSRAVKRVVAEAKAANAAREARWAGAILDEAANAGQPQVESSR